MFELGTGPGYPVDDLLREGPVIGMYALYHQIYCWL